MICDFSKHQSAHEISEDAGKGVFPLGVSHEWRGQTMDSDRHSVWFRLLMKTQDCCCWEDGPRYGVLLSVGLAGYTY